MAARIDTLAALSSALLMFVLAGCTHGPQPETRPMPQLRTVGHVTQLFADDKPLLLLGGELGNSTASDLAVLERALSKCRRMNLNAVFLPVYWDRIEPREGAYDFALVRGAIDLARRYELRIVYLWFGTWKNSMSCYAPSWVKRDTARFPRVRTSAGETLEIITPQSESARAADARAFAALMRWTRQYDADARTVVMVQVENEVGIIPQARDHSERSRRAHAQPVPEALLALAGRAQLGPEVAAVWEKAGRRTTGSWGEVFGAGAEGDEIFSAWQIASYVENVAAAGKREYPLPMFANAALVRPGYRAGQYPSGGPLPHLIEVWRAGAPSLDMICPDIYFPNFAEWAGRYARGANPIFIPEMAPSARAPANALYAAAQLGAIGFGPFAIENVGDEKERSIANCYNMLAGLSGTILTCQQDRRVIGLSPQIDFDWSVKEESERGELGGIVFEARFEKPTVTGREAWPTTLPTLGPGRWEAPPGTLLGSVMILQLSDETFVVAGMGVTLTFAPADGKGKIGIDRVQEGQYDREGTWRGGRWLNGDETHQGRHVRLYDGRWTVQRVTLYRYE